MRCFILLFIRLTMLIMLFYYADGCASLKCFQGGSVDLYVSKANRKKLSLKLLWSHVVGCGSCGYHVNLYPVYEASYIVALDYYGVVKKLNFNTGECIWSKKLSGVSFSGFFKKSAGVPLSGSVVVHKDCLYFGSGLSKVYALDVNTGAVLWIAKVFGEVISRPIVGRGLVLVYTSNGMLQALDEQTGMIKWTTSFEISNFSFRVTLLPVIHDNIVIFGDPFGVVNACHIDTGELVWQKKISVLRGLTDIDRLSNIIAPVVVDNIVYAIAYNGNIEALDLFSGALIWSRNLGSLLNIIVQDSFIYLIDQFGHVMVLNKVNGNVIWSKSDLMDRHLVSMILYKSYIFIGDSKGYLYCLSKKDGVILGKKKISFGFLNHMLVMFDKIVVYENNGRLSVWSLFSGNL